MNEWEKELLNKSFGELDRARAALKKKKPFIENIEEGDILLIDNTADKNKSSYIGIVDWIVPRIGYSSGICIPVSCQQGRYKILSIKDGKCSFTDAEPFYQSIITPYSILHKGKEIVDKVLRKKYNSSFKETGLE